MRRSNRTRKTTEPVGHARPGFTLVEVLTVVLLVGVLGAVAVSHQRRVRRTATTALMTADVMRYRGLQDVYRLKAGRYGAPAEIQTGGWTPSGRAVVASSTRSASGWTLVLADSGTARRCTGTGGVGGTPTVPACAGFTGP